MTFIKKSTSAVAIGISGWVLEAVGFQKPETDALTGLVTRVEQQPTSAVWGIRLVIIVPIVIFMSLAFYFSSKIKLTARNSRMISELLSVRQNLKASSEDSLSAMTNGFLEDNEQEATYSEQSFVSALTEQQKANYEEIKRDVLKIS